MFLSSFTQRPVIVYLFWKYCISKQVFTNYQLKITVFLSKWILPSFFKRIRKQLFMYSEQKLLLWLPN